VRRPVNKSYDNRYVRPTSVMVCVNNEYRYLSQDYPRKATEHHESSVMPHIPT
jgi:hypothetical protein